MEPMRVVRARVAQTSTRQHEITALLDHVDALLGQAYEKLRAGDFGDGQAIEMRLRILEAHLRQVRTA
jgi:hypothetical protein